MQELIRKDQSELKWTEQQRKAAFKFAEHEFQTRAEFQDMPIGTVKKIKRIKNTLDPNRFHSLYEIEGKIYASNGIIGEGGFGVVRKIENLEGNKYVLKVELCHELNRQKFAGFLKPEIEITYDMGHGITKDRSYRLQQKWTFNVKNRQPIMQFGKYYSIQKNLGQCFFKFLLKNTDLSDSQRLDFAIQACRLVEDLHSGRSSKSGQPYAHCDLKPENFTIDSHLKLSLIDFGMTNTQLDQRPKDLMGTNDLLPQNYYDSTRRKIDIFALKRILNCDKNNKSFDGFKVAAISSEVSVLPIHFLKKYPDLYKAISTSNNETDQNSVAKIYKELMLVKKPDLSKSQRALLNLLETEKLLTIGNVDLVISGELDQDNFSTYRSVLLATKDLDLDFETIKGLSDKQLPESSFQAVNQTIQQSIGSDIDGGQLDEKKQFLLHELEKTVYQHIANSQDPQAAFENYIIQTQTGESSDKGHRTLRLLEIIGLFLLSCLAVGTSYASDKLSHHFQNGRLTTNREQQIRQAYRNIMTDEKICQSVTLNDENPSKSILLNTIVIQLTRFIIACACAMIIYKILALTTLMPLLNIITLSMIGLCLVMIIGCVLYNQVSIDDLAPSKMNDNILSDGYTPIAADMLNEKSAQSLNQSQDECSQSTADDESTPAVVTP
ncbi:hypothetical protein N9Y17_02920 [Gammaproteobacteria bacterium]|nr:hypothetical protein [Gammaproteobacteria bacterium]